MDERTELACWRLDAFSDKFERGQVVDAATGLTRDDLDRVLTHLARTRNMVSIRYTTIEQLTAEHMAERAVAAARGSAAEGV